MAIPYQLCNLAFGPKNDMNREERRERDIGTEVIQVFVFLD